MRTGETRSSSAPGRAARSTAALACLIAAAASPAGAWTPETQLAIAARAASISPPDLARQIDRHEREFQRGVLAPFDEAGSGAAGPDRARRLGRLLPAEVEGAVAAIRGHRPFREVVYRLGVLAHRLAEANDPLALATPGEAARYAADYRRYVDSARERFSVVFYGAGRAVERPADVARLLEVALDRGRELRPAVGEEYARVGAIDGVRLFDDRSTAFGVGSVAFSHAVSDAAAVFRYVWIRAGGHDPRELPVTPIAAPRAAGR